MSPSVEIVGVASAAFVSTSLDNLAVLIALFASPDLRPRRVAAGYLVASWAVAAAAWGGSKLFDLVPAPDLGFLGVVPLALGIQRVFALRHSAPDVAKPVPTAGGVVVTVLLTLSQSADNSIVYVTLFADSASVLDPIVFATLVACPVAWCASALWLARRSPLAGPLRRTMRFVVPFLLIAVGAYVLADTVTDVLVH
ncbi:MAG TPA: cadmium resistance transporter [Myxococcota bacterium]|nr:cadmium resistance transporter [Myxococcota bacterium]